MFDGGAFPQDHAHRIVMVDKLGTRCFECSTKSVNRFIVHASAKFEARYRAAGYPRFLREIIKRPAQP
jgi:hypothetical protein